MEIDNHVITLADIWKWVRRIALVVVGLNYEQIGSFLSTYSR